MTLPDHTAQFAAEQETAAVGTSAASPEQTGWVAEAGGTIGPYRLIHVLGRGGMGQVWLAEQTAPVTRQVALKLIKAGHYDTEVVQRFEAERQALAVMDHPAIAKVFDAGATPEGQPYFVMEYVDGQPVNRFCDRKKLTNRERLRLFLQICEGVQHAHQKAIIHRDLKPSNILVAEVDGRPAPRIIDFGIAKATSGVVGEDDKTAFTQLGALMGTPGYMSPEQTEPNAFDIDTRSDVYSLGALLYELLTGCLPFEQKRQPIYDMLRQLREDDPPTPSNRLGKERETLFSTAELRGSTPKALVSSLRGDLDWIAMKALERDRDRRYGTPSELAADIGRYLNDEPVVARPASVGYRARKYVTRHKVGVGITAALVLLLAAFGVAQFLQLRRITRERDRADRVTAFMVSMFKVSDPSEARGNTITARSILDKASRQIDTDLAQDPELQAQLLHTMGDAYGSLGLYSEQRSLLERALAIQTRILGPNDRETLRTARSLALAGASHRTG
jgi:non-specific serine/threonine protein kinase/serine/threonine-protein kinase